MVTLHDRLTSSHFFVNLMMDTSKRTEIVGRWEHPDIGWVLEIKSFQCQVTYNMCRVLTSTGLVGWTYLRNLKVIHEKR